MKLFDRILKWTRREKEKTTIQAKQNRQTFPESMPNNQIELESNNHYSKDQEECKIQKPQEEIIEHKEAYQVAVPVEEPVVEPVKETEERISVEASELAETYSQTDKTGELVGKASEEEAPIEYPADKTISDPFSVNDNLESQTQNTPEIRIPFLQGLNNEQLEAVTTTEGFVRVIAGAGSGKTRALTFRYAYLVNIVGIPPKNILCSTFTNKAANEMKQRIRVLTGGQDTGFVCTFHSLCVAILQEDGHFFHYPRSFRVLDNADVHDILGNIYEEFGFTSRDMTYKTATEMIGRAKFSSHANYYVDMISMSLDELRKKYREAESIDDKIFYGYVYQEKKMFGLDFNDLIVLTIYLFEQAPEIKKKWQKQFQYIMVDEYQDISPTQKAIMEILSEYHKNLFVVGDSDQTIYSWRGSNMAFMQNFAEEHDGTKTILMNRNYRSTPDPHPK